VDVTLSLAFWDGRRMRDFEEKALREKYFGARRR
jgi:hypothetical protein